MPSKKPSAATAPNPAETWEWRPLAERVGIIGSAIVGTSLIWNFVGPILDSGPLPLPSRAEVKVVADKLASDEKINAAIQAETVSRLDDMKQQNQNFALQQRTDRRDSLTNRLRSLQGAIDQAKAIYDKDQSNANQKVLEALNTQLTELNRQIMDMSTPAP